MNVWVVWRLNCSTVDQEYILGVYKSKNEALKICNELNSSFSNDYELMESENIATINWTKEKILKFDSYDEDTTYYCTRIKNFNNKTNVLYFTMICELAGAENYGDGDSWIYVHNSKKSAINEAIQYYNYEHEAEDCDYCEKSLDDTCKKIY